MVRRQRPHSCCTVRSLIREESTGKPKPDQARFTPYVSKTSHSVTAPSNLCPYTGPVSEILHGETQNHLGDESRQGSTCTDIMNLIRFNYAEKEGVITEERTERKKRILFRRASHRKKILRGNQQCKASSGDERHGPDQIQIHPGFSQNVETQLLIDDEGDQPGDEQISERMDKQGD
jgi:hypothetical protein